MIPETEPVVILYKFCTRCGHEDHRHCRNCGTCSVTYTRPEGQACACSGFVPSGNAEPVSYVEHPDPNTYVDRSPKPNIGSGNADSKTEDR